MNVRCYCGTVMSVPQDASRYTCVCCKMTCLEVMQDGQVYLSEGVVVWTGQRRNTIDERPVARRQNG